MHDSSDLALIGCGAISEAAYLPALAANPRWRRALWLVEPNARRGADIARRFGFARDRVVPSHDDLPGGLALAINATPSHLHRPITTALIDRGVAVLVEKPFAENATNARAMVAAAAAKSRVLSVNQSRRAGPSNEMIRSLIRSGKLGRIVKITWSEGRPFDWPTQSGFNFRRPWQGRPRGVLLDIGVHVLDLLCWWLGETPVTVSAKLDGQGAPEATAAVQMTIGSATVDLRLSYLVKLRNELLIEGTRGSLRASTSDYDRFDFREGNARWSSLRARGSTDAIVNTSRLIGNILAAVAGQEALAIDAASTIGPCGNRRHLRPGSRHPVRLLCRASGRQDPGGGTHKQRHPGMNYSVKPLKPRILVTGANGFVGGWFVEAIHLAGWGEVRAGMSRWSGAARIARFPVELCICDVMDRASLDAALGGVDIVIHCARGREATVRSRPRAPSCCSTGRGRLGSARSSS